MLFPLAPLPSGLSQIAGAAPTLLVKRDVEYRELAARSWLNRCSSTRVPFEWTVNPYRGCEFGCKYCYARYTHEFMEADPAAFEHEIYAKVLTPARLVDELSKVGERERIALGTATDPYQPAERRFHLTRQFLEVFQREKGRRLSITTKSDLVAQDASLLASVGKANIVQVNLTITTLDAKLAREIEPRAPRPDLRLKAVKALRAKGVAVGVTASPVLPLLTDQEGSLRLLAQAAAEAGAQWFGGHPVFLRSPTREIFFDFMEKRYPRLAPKYRRHFTQSSFLPSSYGQMLAERIEAARNLFGLGRTPVEYRPEQWPQERQQRLF